MLFHILASVFVYVMICVFLGVADAIFPIMSDWTILSIAGILGIITFLFVLFAKKAL